MDDSRLFKLLALNLSHVGINLNTPLSEGLVILEFGDQFLDLLHSLLSTANFISISLDVSHLLLVPGEVLGEGSSEANFGGQVDSFAVTSFPIVDIEKRLTVFS